MKRELVRLGRDGDVAIITADNPPVNALSLNLRTEMVDAVHEIATTDAHAMVLCCGGATFFAGADIAELDRGVASPGLTEFEQACTSVRQPVIAAMRGHVLGGGVVVAYSADWRMAADQTCFAMPEIELGLIATFGGTQLLPRLIGVEHAIALLVYRQVFNADRALATGLIDAVVPGPALVAEAVRFARTATGKRRIRTIEFDEEGRRAGLEEVDRARSRVLTLWPEWQAPLATLEAMRRGLEHGLARGLAHEAELFERLRTSRQSALLRRLFFARRRLARKGLSPALAETLLQVADGPFDPEREEEQRRALRALDPDRFGGPALFDAAVAQALGWPIWKCDIFFHDGI